MKCLGFGVRRVGGKEVGGWVGNEEGGGVCPVRGCSASTAGEMVGVGKGVPLLSPGDWCRVEAAVMMRVGVSVSVKSHKNLSVSQIKRDPDPSKNKNQGFAFHQDIKISRQRT